MTTRTYQLRNNLDTYAFDEIEVDKQHSDPAYAHDICRNMYALSITWEYIGIPLIRYMHYARI